MVKRMWTTLIASGIMLAFLALFSYGYHEGYANAKESQLQADNAALVHENVVEEKSATINAGATNDFHKDEAAIATLYKPEPLSLPSGIVSDLPHLSRPTRRISTRSKRYNLTFESCDIEESKLKALYKAWQDQAAIK